MISRVEDELRLIRLILFTARSFHTELWNWDVFSGGIPLLGTCTIYFVFKFGLVWVHLWQHFRVSSLSLSFTQCNTHSLGSYAPFTFPWQLQPQSTNVGFSVRWRVVVRWGWNSRLCQSPSKQTCAKAPCVYKQFNWIRLNVCSGLIWQSQIHPELSKATDEWLELSVFQQMQTHLLRSTTSSCTNQNQGDKEEK